MEHKPLHDCVVAVVGSGPAGLMAAEVIATAGVDITVFERMPSVGRKLLMAGRGGLNITHSEPLERFRSRYGTAADWMAASLASFSPQDLIAWCGGLGQPTFVGSSGRVFPQAMKASPLLRAWVRRLEGMGVRFVTRTAWTGWNDAGALTFATGAAFSADATVLALGGASWPRLGSDGGWASLLPDIEIAALRPANCGFAVDWAEPFRARYAGSPLKGCHPLFRRTARPRRRHDHGERHRRRRRLRGWQPGCARRSPGMVPRHCRST